MKKITLLLAMLVVSFGYSQTLPIDFEESDDSNIFASVSDGGTFSIIDDAVNTGESVGQFSGKVGGALYDHINVPLSTSLDIAATNTISFRVKQTTTEGTTSHLFKLQPNGGTGSNQEVAFTTEYDVWKDVSLTYSGTGTYNELIIFFDFNSASVSGTYLIDDIVASSGQTPSPNSVTVATSQEWNAYVNAYNVSDDAFAFGFGYTVSDLRATPTTTSMTLEPNTAIWTANATDAGWFDQGAATQTANKYIEALSYIEDATLANEELTFSGNISVSDLGDGYTVVAFIKTLTSSYSTVAYKTADISSTGDFTITATADEMSQAVIQYGFSVTGPLADPADTSLGSVVVGTEAPPASGNDVTVATSQEWNAYVNAYNVSDDAFAFGFGYTVSDLRATPTTTSMTLEPNTAIWTANATDAGWFDQGAATQTANKYIEALSYIEDATLANEELTFSGNISVSDLGDGYTVVAFIKTLTSSYSTVAYKTADISSTGDFTITATADEMSQAVIQYGFSVTGPLADPADTSLGSVVVGTEAPPASGNDVTVATSQEWNAYVNAYNVSDDAFAFGFGYTVSDLRATPTTTSMTLEPNTAIWTANATDAGWFDQGAATQTANKYIEALSYIEDATLANEELTFSGNISVSDLGDGYTVVAFIKTLTSSYSTVAYKTADISSTGDFTITATADEMSQAVIQYGFSVTGPLADPANTSLGSVVVGTGATASIDDNNIVNISVYPNPSSSNWNFRTGNTVITLVEVFNLLGKRVVSQNNNSTNVAISTQGLTSGIYIARITTEQGTKSVKLIKN